MSATAQLETSEIPHAISVVRLTADIFRFYEKDKLFTGEQLLEVVHNMRNE